jgi:hypothetical protein
VIGNDEEAGGIGEWLVLCKPARIGVSVRADEGKVAHGFVQSAGDGSNGGFGGEKTVLMKNAHGIYFHP